MGSVSITCERNTSGGHLWRSRVLSTDRDVLISSRFPSPFNPYRRRLGIHAPSDNKILCLDWLRTPPPTPVDMNPVFARVLLLTLTLRCGVTGAAATIMVPTPRGTLSTA